MGQLDDMADSVKMLLAICQDPYTTLPASCMKCKDRTGNVISPEKAIFHANEEVRRYEENGVIQEPSGALQVDE